jgi:tRNA-dihydrouridine synthase 1
MTANLDLNYIAAPMVNQSDTPFRALAHNHGATLTYTEMLRPARLLSDPDYLAFHRRSLELGRNPSTGPVIVQVCGNDQDVILRGAKTVVDLCDGIGMCASDLSCAKTGHDLIIRTLANTFACEAA